VVEQGDPLGVTSFQATPEVVAASGHWGFHGDMGADLSDLLVAYALPRE
jgi:hypothetical protein